MKKKKYILLSILLFIGNSIGLAQDGPGVSPEANIMMRNINLNVNKSTGVAGVSIPLYTISYGNLQVPLSLNYNCSGIKVSDIATWVGTGWNLSAGGQITRMIADKDDKFGYIGSQGQAANGAWTAANFEQLEANDTEPDMFYYQIPGAAGMFVFDWEGNAHTIPYNPNIKIETLSLNNFTITDTQGTKYYFKCTETTTVRHSTNNVAVSPYTSAWNLTTIKSLQGDIINFDYIFSNVEYIDYSEVKYEGDKNEIKNTSKNIRIRKAYLSEISWDDNKLIFESSTNRNDLTNGRRLEKIKFGTTGKYIGFNYSTFSYSRLKLDNIRDYSGTSSILRNKFVYNTTNLPSRDSKNFDHWGYYNGANNTTNFNANRTPNFNYTKANILTEVHSGMGGYKSFVYSANSGLTDITNNLGGKTISGVRIDKIYTYETPGAAADVVTYTYNNGICYNSNVIYSNSLGRTTVYYSHSSLNMNDIGGSNVYYGKVKESFSNGSYIESEFTTYDKYNDIKSRMYFVPGVPGEYQDNPNISLYQNTSQFWKRGMLLSEVHKNSSNLVTHRVDYKYKDPIVKNNIYGYIARTEQTAIASFNRYIKYAWISETVAVDKITTTGMNTPETIVENTYDTKYMLPIQQKTTIGGNVYLTKIKYPSSYNNPTNVGNAISKMLECNLISQPIEVLNYKNNKIIGGALSIFNNVLINGSYIPLLKETKSLFVNESISNITESIYSNGTFTYNNRYVTDNIIAHYDGNGYPATVKEENGLPQSTIYEKKLPVATIANANAGSIGYNEVYHTSFENETGTMSHYRAKTGKKVMKNQFAIPLATFKSGQYLLTYWKSTDNGANWVLVENNITINSSSTSYTIGSTNFLIDEVRIHPINAVMETKTFAPFIGETSKTDANGVTTYYEYDKFGRLIRILDNNRNKLKEYEYFNIIK